VSGKREVVKASLTLVNGRPKRQRYVRFFPDRIIFLQANLSPRLFMAYLRLCAMVAVNDGLAPDDDKVLAQFSGLPIAGWRELRSKLEMLGLAGGENGRWIDRDQQAAFELQRRGTARGMAGAEARWGKRQD